MTTHTINGEKIHVDYDSEHAFWTGRGYVAVTDSYDPTPVYCDDAWGDVIGYGKTEQEALDDLLGQLEDQE
jgi:hypothetical protein